PIQGEGGVVIPHPEYLAGARRLCDERGVLLVFDEIQVGMGRTGTLFAYEQTGIEPDVMTLAKALASGLPIGAALAREAVAESFTIASHGSTFGGNAAAAAAAVATLNTMLADGFLANVRARGAHFLRRIQELAAKHSAIADVRGHGLMLAITLREQGA